jgi:hypothetical protein
MNVIDYITITCNLKKCPITDYIRLHEKCNRLQPITITNYEFTITPLNIYRIMFLVAGNMQNIFSRIRTYFKIPWEICSQTRKML